MAQWSNIIDAAKYESVDQAIYGDTPALRIARALTACPSRKWPDEIASAMMDETLEEVAGRVDSDRARVGGDGALVEGTGRRCGLWAVAATCKARLKGPRARTPLAPSDRNRADEEPLPGPGS